MFETTVGHLGCVLLECLAMHLAEALLGCTEGKLGSAGSVYNTWRGRVIHKYECEIETVRWPLACAVHRKVLVVEALVAVANHS